MFELGRWNQTIFLILFSALLVFVPRTAIAQSSFGCDCTDKLFLGGVIGAVGMLAVWVAYSVGNNKWK
jgi:hypothetical protein